MNARLSVNTNVTGFRIIYALALVTVLVAALNGCKEDVNEKKSSATNTLYERGKVVYMARCTSCHNMNPKYAGSLGPEIFGSSKNLILMRVLEAKYPEGYTPKRGTNLMTPMPDLKNEIDALYEYLRF